jgi:hypothetical protein
VQNLSESGHSSFSFYFDLRWTCEFDLDSGGEPDREQAYAAPVAEVVRAKGGMDGAGAKDAVDQPRKREGHYKGGQHPCDRDCRKNAQGGPAG